MAFEITLGKRTLVMKATGARIAKAGKAIGQKVLFAMAPEQRTQLNVAIVAAACDDKGKFTPNKILVELEKARVAGDRKKWPNLDEAVVSLVTDYYVSIGELIDDSDDSDDSFDEEDAAGPLERTPTDSGSPDV